jgi:UDP-N-acetylmuramate dehydrogenase
MMALRNSQALRGELLLDAPLKGLNSWRVGGSADRLYRPADLDDLCLFLRGLDADEPLTWLGLGTNVLVRDGGVRGTVIAMHQGFNRVCQRSALRVAAQAGAPCAKLARFCAGHGLAGAEFMVGIPGTVGGALAMNAGAFGGQTWDIVSSVETIDRRGQVRRRRPAEFSIAYREVRLPREEWFVAAEFELQAGDRPMARAAISELLTRRQASQPLGVASCGSVFRNPPGDYAARLIDAAGLKGHCVGGACVSTKHANFIINAGNATAADIEALIEFVGTRVAETHGLRLVPEVRIVGERR